MRPPPWIVDIVRDPDASSPHRMKVSLRTRGKLEPRPVRDIIRLYPIGPDEKRLPVKELRIQGDIVQDVAAFPQAIHHGRQQCGKTIGEAIQLRSLTGRPFRVKEVIRHSPDLEVDRMAGASQNWCYSLRLHVARPGDQNVEAVFVIEEDDGNAYRISVPVRYHGLTQL